MKRGDIVLLGPHRLMCGDCTSHADVKDLFGDKKASTLIFSPPYLKRRTYDTASCHNDVDLFLSALEEPPCVPDVQVFAVVGNLHSNGEQDTFYEAWIQAARRRGWKRFSTYVWDKGHGLPGRWNGRLAPCFEWVFHLNKMPREPIKHVKTIWGEGRHFRKSRYSEAFTLGRKVSKADTTGDYKIDNAIIRVNPSGRLQRVGHPASFPYHLPQRILQSYGKKDGFVYDPMAGSGGVMIAADTLGLPSLNIEISPAYCQLAIDRFNKYKEKT